MNPKLTNYLNIKQYKNICKYWTIITTLKYKLNNFDYSKYMSYEEYSDDEETISECIKYNDLIQARNQILTGKLEYYELEYANYINKLGFKFGDRTQDEILFNLLNDGLIC